MSDRAHMPALAGVECYEDIVGAADGLSEWPELDENSAWPKSL
jgi:hypothetical protein